jgi:hypothetical protein
LPPLPLLRVSRRYEGRETRSVFGVRSFPEIDQHGRGERPLLGAAVFETEEVLDVRVLAGLLDRFFVGETRSGLDEKRPEADAERGSGVACAAEVIPVAGEEFEFLLRDKVWRGRPIFCPGPV